MGAVLRRRALIGAFGRLVRAMVGTVGIDEAMDGILAVAEGEYGGRGADTDMIGGWARAYMHAVKRLLAMGDVTRAPEAAGAV